jgi:hypothetical protein
VFLTSLGLAACGDGCGTRHGAQSGTRSVETLRLRQYYEQLHRLESRTLEPFESDDELFHYLDTLAFMQERLAEDVPPERGLPQLPEEPPPRQRPLSTSAMAHYGGLVSRQFTYGPFPEEPQRLIAHRGRVFSLYDNTLRSFELEPASRTLQKRAQLRLGAPLPSIHARRGVDRQGAGIWLTEVEGSYEGVVKYDYLFASQSTLILVGTRWDTEALSVERVAIGEDGGLKHLSTHDIHLRRKEAYGYRARWVDEGLTLYTQMPLLHEATPGTSGALVYTLPWLSTKGPFLTPDRELLSRMNVQRPQLHDAEPMLHVLVRCTFVSPEFTCGAQAINAPATLDFLMGSDAVYPWVTGWREGDVSAGTFLYRMPYSGEAPSAVRIAGPVESRLEGGPHETAGALHALSRKDGALSLLAIPLSAFSEHAPDLAKTQRRALPRKLAREGVDTRLMLAPGHLVYGDNKQLQRGSFSPWLQAIDLASAQPFKVKLGHASSIAAALHDDTLVVGSDDWNLHTSLVAFAGDRGQVLASTQIRNAARDYSPNYALHMLPQAGDGGWFLLQMQAAPGYTLLLPFHWDQEKAAFEAFPPWSAPDAARRDFQPFPNSIDLLSIGDDLVVVRVQEQLLVQRFAASPTLRQRIALEP